MGGRKSNKERGKKENGEVDGKGTGKEGKNEMAKEKTQCER